MTITIYEVVAAMRLNGGSFIQRLAAAWEAADQANRCLIEDTWRSSFDAYRTMAERVKSGNPTGEAAAQASML